MNTSTANYVPCGCKAHLNEKDPRAEIWRNVFGCLEFPLKNPISHIGQAEGEHEDRFLYGDWDALSFDQKVKMLIEMKKKFGISEQVFSSQVKALGYIPIKDQNIDVVICQKHTGMMIC